MKSLLSSAETRFGRWVLAVFAVALLARLAFMAALGTWEFSDWDDHWHVGWETGRIAWNVAEGHGFTMEREPDAAGEYTPTAWLAPVYPWLVSLPFRMFGSFSTTAIVWILGFQVLVSALTAVAVMFLGREVASHRVGVLAGVLFALAPASINTSTRIVWCTTLFTLLAVVLVTALVRQARSGTKKSALGIGALMGLTMLTSPVLALFYAAISFWLMARRKLEGLAHSVLMAIGCVVVILPWVVRNHAEFGKVFLVKSNFGHELFMGNNETADGLYHRLSEVIPETVDHETRVQLGAANEAEYSSLLGELSSEWIRANPGRFLALTWVRVSHYWRTPFISNWESFPGGAAVQSVMSWTNRLGYYATLVLALVGVTIGWRRRHTVGPLALILLTLPVPYYLTHLSFPRYRFPFVPFVLVLTAIALVNLGTRITNVSRERAN